MNLGYRQAGAYITKNNAAYWDGMTDTGDRASSGVYFYVIQVGDYTAIRKMVVAK